MIANFSSRSNHPANPVESIVALTLSRVFHSKPGVLNIELRFFSRCVHEFLNVETHLLVWFDVVIKYIILRTVDTCMSHQRL